MGAPELPRAGQGPSRVPHCHSQFNTELKGWAGLAKPSRSSCSVLWLPMAQGKEWEKLERKNPQAGARQSNHPPVTVTGKTRSPGRAWVHFLPINFNYLYSFLSPQVTLSPQVSPFLSHAHMPLLHSLYFSWKAKKKISAVSQWYQFFCVTVGVFCSPTCSLTGMGEVSSSKAVLKIKRQITHIFIDSS